MIIRQKLIKLRKGLPNFSDKLGEIPIFGSCKKHRGLWLGLLTLLASFLVAYYLKDPVCHLVMFDSSARARNGKPHSSKSGSKPASSRSKIYQHSGSFPPLFGFSSYSSAIIHPRVRDVFMSEVFWKSFVATSASLLCITGGAFLAYTKITRKRLRELDEIYKKRRGDVHHMQRIRHLYGLRLDDDPYLNAQEEDTPETERDNPATGEN